MGYMNFYATKLQGQIGASDSTIQVQTPPTTTSGRLVIEPRNVQKREIIRYTGVSGTNLTGCIRGQGGTTAQVHNGGSLVQMNVTAEDLSEALAVNSNLTQYTDELMPDCVVPGTGVIAVSSGLTCTISDITYYINGIRYTKTGISNKTFTASKDTYCFIDTAGNITYSEVANNAAAPAAPANSICFGLVVSSVSSIWYISMFDSKPAFRLTRSAAFSIPRSSTTRYAYDVIAYNYGLNRPRTNPGEGSQGGIVIQQPGVYDLKAFVLVGDNPTNIGLHIAVNGTKVASGSNGTYAYPGLHFAEDMKFDKGDVVEVRLTNLVSDRDPFTEYQTAMFSGHLVRPA